MVQLEKSLESLWIVVPSFVSRTNVGSVKKCTSLKCSLSEHTGTILSRINTHYCQRGFGNRKKINSLQQTTIHRNNREKNKERKLFPKPFNSPPKCTNFEAFERKKLNEKRFSIVQQYDCLFHILLIHIFLCVKYAKQHFIIVTFIHG